MKKNMVRYLCGLSGILLAASLQAQTITGSLPLSAGDLVVYRVGDSLDPDLTTTNLTTDVWLDEYTASGTLVGSMEMPTNAVGAYNPLTANGPSTAEGFLTISPNEVYIGITGYDAVTGVTTATTAAASLVPRTIGILNVTNGNLDTSTALTDASSGSSIRSAVTPDGSNIWVVGGAGGVRYATIGSSTSTSIATNTYTGSALTNLRQIGIYATAANPSGQLMVSDQSGSVVRIGSVGSGLPTTSSQAITNLPGTSGASPAGPYAFVQLTLGGGSVPDTMYVADDLNSLVEKWNLVSGNWTLAGSEPMTAPRGITAEEIGGNPNDVDIFVTAGSSTVITNIDEFTDTSGAGGTFSSGTNVLVNLPSGEQFRGIVDLTLVPEPSTIVLVGAGLFGLLAIRRRRRA